MCGKLENMQGLHQREPLNQGHVTLTISPKNSWLCHALKFTWESSHMILDLWIQAQEEPWSTTAKDISIASEIKHHLQTCHMEKISSQNHPTEEFMSLDLPLESMKSLANANQALYTYSSPAFSMTLTAKHVKESGGGCGFSPRMRLWLRGCQREASL